MPWTATQFGRVAGKVFAIVSSLGTIYLTAFQWKKELGHASEIKTRWVTAALEYDLLWTKIKDEKTIPQAVKTAYDRITKKRAELEKHDPGFSIDQELVDRCYDEALAAKTGN